MTARLRLIDETAARRFLPLGSRDFVIGRDPTCDLPIDSPHVSWHHAAIHPVGSDRYLISDLDSTNGTSINGAPLANLVTLRAGDVIDFAGVVRAEFELFEEAEDPGTHSRVRQALIAVAAVSLLAVSFLLLWPADGEDRGPLERATNLAQQAIEAARSDEDLRARDLLREAAGLLYTSGYLDDVPRGELQRAAMQRLQSELSVNFDLWTFYDNALSHVGRERPQLARRQGRCRLDEVGSGLLEPCLQQWIEFVLESLHQEPDSIPPGFNRRVGTRLKVENEFLRRSLERGTRIVPMLRRELEAARMPPILHYVALIESGYRSTATSPAAAGGLWQFMPATARQYGLAVGVDRDDRRDPEKSTRAAARYLRDLAFEFGGDALLLALAGYNRGENGVRKSLKKLDDPFSERSYWRLVERGLLPPETREYVERFIAAAVAGEGGLPSKAGLASAGY